MQGCGREIGGLPCCTIIHGDCNDYLWMVGPNSVDLVVTDTPFGMNFVSGARKEKYNAIEGDDRLPVETIQELISIPRLASYFFCRWDNLWHHETLPKPKSVLTWVKPGTGMGDLEHEHGRASEVVMFYPGPEHAFKKRPSDIMDARRTGNVIHPTQKPVELISMMLGWYDFETVLDPYMGSGTTAVAAMNLHKHFLGFEKADEHYATAVDRVEGLRGRPAQQVGGFDFNQEVE
jgi:site-specific DNA-methyltransferase (adenine-specific)